LFKVARHALLAAGDLEIVSVWNPSYLLILMEHVGDPPRIDLDNLAKALLDALTGFVFFDDSQVARLLVERAEGERDRISIRCRRRGAPPT